ncbi:MAG: hypothetical protein ACFCGT_24120 [Sandaracinaceae bacterium]
MPARFALLLGLAVALAPAATAHADGPFEGQWREGPLRISVDVDSWGGDCGPRPQSVTAPGGGTFRITQSGDQLTFNLRRQQTTRSCWSENRAVRRVSSSYSASSQTWRIVCRTPPDDSRGETGTYTLRAAGPDRLEFRDVSRYDWQLNASRCVATITTSQSYTRVAARPTTPEPERPTPPEPEPEQPSACRPGPADRLLVAPRARAVAPGEEVCFTARVVDAQGCRRSDRVTYALAPASPGRLRGRCYRAAQGTGEATVIARSGALSREARITVRMPDLSDLIARRSETGSLGSGTRAEVPEAESGQAARVRTASDGPGAGVWWTVGLGGLLLLAGALALLLRGRRSAAAVPAPQDPGPAPEPWPTDPMVADDGEGGRDAQDLICPTCRRGYPPGTPGCPHDGDRPIPYAEFLAGGSRKTAGRTCPVCGTVYPPTVAFCGQDGTPLRDEDDGPAPA